VAWRQCGGWTSVFYATVQAQFNAATHWKMKYWGCLDLSLITRRPRHCHTDLNGCMGLPTQQVRPGMSLKPKEL